MARRRKANPAMFVTFNTSDSSIVAGDLVAVDTLNDNSVIRADASDSVKMPAIGIAKSVRSSSIVVQLDYIYTLPSGYGVAVSCGQELYADPSSPGKITTSIPSTGILQKVGVGKKATNKILLSIDNFSLTL